MSKDKSKTNKRKIATTSMAVLGLTLVVGGTFAALSDTLSHDESVTVEWVDIVDGSSTNLALEDVSDVNNTPVSELTPGITYELTGTLENDSTVVTEWTATDLTTTPGMTVNIADVDGADAPVNVGEDVDVSQFGITVTVDQSVTPSTDLNFIVEFSSTDARGDIPTIEQPTAIGTIFSDPAMATCIANDDESPAAGDVNYQISQAELNNITELNCPSSGIASIEGMQYLTNLEVIDLNTNNISDLTPLSSLYNLTHISLGVNQISDLTPLENLTDLTYLSLYNNEITDISPLAELTNLTTLHIHTNHISDITVVTNMTNLTNLDLGVNEITDISALENLTNLEYLSLSNNEVSDLTPLTGLTNLISLNLNSNKITDVTPIANLMNLETLYLSNNNISDFSSLTYQPENYMANQVPKALPDTSISTPTQITIDGVNGEDLIIEFITPGTYSNGEITWTNPGANSLNFWSADGKTSGTITQTVY